MSITRKAEQKIKSLFCFSVLKYSLETETHRQINAAISRITSTETTATSKSAAETAASRGILTESARTQIIDGSSKVHAVKQIADLQTDG